MRMDDYGLSLSLVCQERGSDQSCEEDIIQEKQAAQNIIQKMSAEKPGQVHRDESLQCRADAVSNSTNVSLSLRSINTL